MSDRRITLREGHALDLIEAAPALDLVVTDPPYAFGGAGEEHAISATVATVLRESARKLKRGHWTRRWTLDPGKNDMTDPLAHLYAETGIDDDVELPVRTTSFDELHAVRGEVEELTDSDLAELAILLRGKIDPVLGTVPSIELVELGLAEVIEDANGEEDVELNPLGRRVMAQLEGGDRG